MGLERFRDLVDRPLARDQRSQVDAAAHHVADVVEYDIEVFGAAALDPLLIVADGYRVDLDWFVVDADDAERRAVSGVLEEVVDAL